MEEVIQNWINSSVDRLYFHTSQQNDKIRIAFTSDHFGEMWGFYAVLLNTLHPNSPDNSICLICVSNSQDYTPILKKISEPVRQQIDQLTKFNIIFPINQNVDLFSGNVIYDPAEKPFTDIPQNKFATKDNSRGPENLLIWHPGEIRNNSTRGVQCVKCWRRFENNIWLGLHTSVDHPEKLKRRTFNNIHPDFKFYFDAVAKHNDIPRIDKMGELDEMLFPKWYPFLYTDKW